HGPRPLRGAGGDRRPTAGARGPARSPTGRARSGLRSAGPRWPRFDVFRSLCEPGLQQSAHQFWSNFVLGFWHSPGPWILRILHLADLVQTLANLNLTKPCMLFHLPDYFFGDLVATFVFGIVAILLIIIGYI